MLSFQLPVRPDEVHSSGWKLVFNQNQCTVSRDYYYSSRFNQQYEKLTPTRRRNLLWNLDHPVTRIMQVTDHKYPHTTTIITMKGFDTKSFGKNKERSKKFGDSILIEGFQCPTKKCQCKSCHKYGQLTSLYYQKKEASFKPQKPKAFLFQARDVYACDKSICATQKIFHLVMSHFVCK